MSTEDHRKALAALRMSAGELSDLADAAYALGNERLGMRLSHIASCIGESAEQADKAYGDFIVQRFEESRAMTGAVLNAAPRWMHRRNRKIQLTRGPWSAHQNSNAETAFVRSRDHHGKASWSGNIRLN